MKERFSKLLTVKSIVTLVLTAIVSYLAIIGKFDLKDIYLMVISFYFGTQKIKE